MKKSIISALALLLGAGSAMAEGYQINSLSAKQIGMGHTGIALKLGGESMYFNPAGMAFMDETLDISGSFTGIMPTAYATDKATGTEYTTDNGVATPINVNAAFSIYPNLKGGVSFYTPYGSSINWTDNWPGAVLSQNVSLKVFTIQPTLSWAITPKLSVGVGAMVSWGTVDLNKGLVSASSADKAIAGMQALGLLPAGTPGFGSTTPASVNLNGKTKVVVGVNVGAMYNFNDKWTVGASFRSKMGMKVKAGNAKVDYTGGALAESLLGGTLGGLHNANFKAEMPCPWVVGLGVSYKPVPRLTLAFDARLTGWSAYKQLDIEFLSEQLRDMDQHMTKIEPTLGLSFRPIPSLSIDFGFMYVAGLGVDNVSCTYEDAMYKGVVGQLMGAGLPLETAAATAAGFGLTPTGKFTADYKLHAFIPSIGVSYKF
ncbi:MAG: hypothetical protein HFJ91_04020 [Muribaculaceae bacterium]|nr:hypothetical protein [Muribaculaceae bacterium]